MSSQDAWTRVKVALTALALGTVLVGGTVVAAPKTGPNSTACERAQAAVKAADLARAKRNSKRRAAVDCAPTPTNTPRATKTPKATSTPKPTKMATTEATATLIAITTVP